MHLVEVYARANRPLIYIMGLFSDNQHVDSLIPYLEFKGRTPVGLKPITIPVEVIISLLQDMYSSIRLIESMPDVAKVKREYVVEILIKSLYSTSMMEAGRSLALNEADLTPIVTCVLSRSRRNLTFVHTFHLSSRVPQKYSECRPESDTKRDYWRTWHLPPGGSQSAMPHPFCDFHGSSLPT